MNPRLFLLGFIVLALGLSCLFLATRTIPAPRHTIEKVISNDRFFK